MKNIIVVFLLLFTSTSNAQTVNQLNSWWTYSGNHKLTKDWSVHNLYSWRRNDFVKNWQQSLLRIGINHHYNDKLIMTAGYDWVVTFPYGEQPISKETTEHRIYEQIVVKNKINKLSLKHRYRLEQRFCNQTTKHRLRYRLTTTIPLIKNNDGRTTLFFSIFNELFINVGQKAPGHYFDQNWLYAGVAFPLKNGIAIKVGYMNQYLVKGDNTRIENNHTPQVGLSYSFDFSKKE